MGEKLETSQKELDLEAWVDLKIEADNLLSDINNMMEECKSAEKDIEESEGEE